MINKTVLVLLIISGVSFLLLDRALFFYGKSQLNYHLLPNGIYPEHHRDFGSEFTLFDQDGFSLIAKGYPIIDSHDKTVAEFVRYGFNKETLIAIVKDQYNHTYAIKINRPQSKVPSAPLPRLSLTVDKLNENQSLREDEAYQWYDLDKQKKVSSLMVWHSWSALVFIISIIVLIVRLNQRFLREYLAKFQL